MYKAGSVWITPEMFMTDEELERQRQEKPEQEKIKDSTLEKIVRSLFPESSDPRDLLYNHLRITLIGYIAGMNLGVTAADLYAIITLLARMLINSAEDYKAGLEMMKETLKSITKSLDEAINEGNSGGESKYR